MNTQTNETKHTPLEVEMLAALEIAIATIERLRPSSRGFDSTRGTKDVVCAAIEKAKGGV